MVTFAGAMAGGAKASVTPLSSEFKINHSDPEASVPSSEARNRQPLEFGYYIQDLVAFAMAAAKSGDHLAEARYYRAFAKAVPDEAIAFSKLCQALEAGGQREQAEQACRDALGRHGIQLDDYVRFVHLVLAKPGQLTSTASADVTSIIDHLQKNPETRIAGMHLQCELALHVHDVALLEKCTTGLSSVAPRDPKTISFLWALALEKGDRTGAENLIARAQAVGVPAGGIERMRQATSARLPTWPRRLLDWRALFAAFLVVSAVTALWILRRRRYIRQTAG
jgi:hypothetical protein